MLTCLEGLFLAAGPTGSSQLSLWKKKSDLMLMALLGNRMFLTKENSFQNLNLILGELFGFPAIFTWEVWCSWNKDRLFKKISATLLVINDSKNKQRTKSGELYWSGTFVNTWIFSRDLLIPMVYFPQFLSSFPINCYDPWDIYLLAL